MAVPIIVNDGNFSRAEQNGADEITLPFSDEGDNTSWEVRRKLRVDQASYRRGISMSQEMHRFGRMYLVEESNPNAIGGGLVEYEQIWSCLPKTRVVPSSTIYSLQGLVDGSITEWPLTMACEIQWEYFIGNFPSPIQAPRLIKIGEFIFAYARWGTFSLGQRIPAEDSEVGVHKGKIFYRKTIYIRYPIDPKNPLVV